MFVLNGLLKHLTDYNKIRTPCAVRSNLRDRIPGSTAISGRYCPISSDADEHR